MPQIHEKKTVVIGASILDVTGIPNVALIKNDSNPGQIFITPGGVARNIAENLALLNLDVDLISAIGNDVWGKILLDLCHQSNIKTNHCVFADNESTALYLSINNLQKNLELAIVNTDIMNKLSPEYIETKSGFINQCPIIIAETNLTEDTLRYIVDEFANIPIFLDVVSTTKAKKVKDFIGKFYAIKPNLAEAETLTGIKMKKQSDLLLMADHFITKGVQQIYITMGKKGCFYANKSERGFVEQINIEPVNTSGAGDAYMAGLVYSHLHQKTLHDSAVFATAMSLAALTNINTVNKHINIDFIEKIIKTHKICSKNTLI